ncbi:arylsulfatase [Ruania alba]|uniref:Arylsulfatase n=1 Tax=Ruania alba TaxID=648782 RepID=A0A1H5NA43_9MICO|nr:arylsulfatase [Ruania alba]SEE97538.1 arylsulfatase [Ruania alba]
MTTSTEERRPNVLLILADDLGFSDLGCYGAEIRTPHLDALAENGVRMSQFCNTARCSPARASLLTGLHPHQTGIGILTGDSGPAGYPGTLNDRCVTMAEVLREHGYVTAMRGKWHLSAQMHIPDDAWPTRRGFDSFVGTLAGAADYYQPATLTRDEIPEPPPEAGFYYTTELGRQAAEFVHEHSANHADRPFFLYLPFTAPHWPLHAPEDVVATYRSVYDDGWDEARQRRYDRLIELGLIDGSWPLSERDDGVVAWDEVADREWQARRMEVYAAQVELMDAAIGTVIEEIRAAGELDDTLVLFLSDNGGCAEEIPLAWVDELSRKPLHAPERTLGGARVRRGNDPAVRPGGPETFASYGRPWANVSNAPFREYKHWVHEGGIATPFIAHWPAGELRVGIDHDPHFLPDVLATVLEATGAEYPRTYPGRDLLPLEGVSMLESWRGEPAPERPLCFEHEGNAALRHGRWKLVRKYGGDWELYDLIRDRTEVNDLAGAHPDRVEQMARTWQEWADRCGVRPRDALLAAQERAGMVPAGHVSDDLRSSRRVPRA